VNALTELSDDFSRFSVLFKARNTHMQSMSREIKQELIVFGLKKRKIRLSTNQPAGSGVADWRAEGRGGGQQAFSYQKASLGKSTIRLCR